MSNFDAVFTNVFVENTGLSNITEPDVLQTDESQSNLKERFSDWFIKRDVAKNKYLAHSFSSNQDKFLKELTRYEELYNEQFGKTIFSFQKKEFSEFINELEKNIYLDEGSFFQFSSKTSNHMPRAILGKNNYLAFLNELMNKQNKSNAKSPVVKPVNIIYFGPPGTGKSYQITENLKDVDLIFQKRVTFHPEYDNVSFIGCYKPVTDSFGNIKYEFIPQIFTNIYVEACNDPLHQYYLIIEEINRGNCAEIFGELFQLLDRNENYKITPSNELGKYLNGSITNSKYYSDDKMLLPSNLSILATMNTSDQSLFPMDSAFKRRWDWEYIPIDYNKDDNINESAKYTIVIDPNTRINWIEFLKVINSKIQDNKNLGMDKCIGNYFVKPDDKNEINIDSFIHKVLFYLWNDVFKDEPRDSIFEDNQSYQSFFPIATNGVTRLKTIFQNLELIASEELNIESAVVV